jgi:RNA polymerase sigma-70 factor (ECF subfamily)
MLRPSRGLLCKPEAVQASFLDDLSNACVRNAQPMKATGPEEVPLSPVAALREASRQAPEALGSPEVWNRLIEANLGWLRGWVRGRVSDPELVHEICQDALLKALRARKSLKDLSKFSTWLYRIATNVLRDHLRKKRRSAARVELSDELDAVPAEKGPTDPLRDREETELLLAAVRALPHRYREPLLLRHAEDLPYAEIGRILKITENAVQVRIFRARKMLRERLEGRRGAPGV